MYFSRVRLRPEIFKSSQLHRVLAGNVYGAHRLLWDLFSAQQRSFLYREEIAREQLGSLANARGESIYYMVSQSKPVEPGNSLFAVDTKNYQPKLFIGQVLSFECRINPVVTQKIVREDVGNYLLARAKRQVKDPNKISHKRVRHDLVMDVQLAFLKGLIKAFNLENKLPTKPVKKDYKHLLITQGGEALNKHLTEILISDIRYAERLQQVSSLPNKLEWTIKAKIDTALENWWKRLGKNCGFELVFDAAGLSKLQNSAYQWHALPEKGKHAGFSSVDFTGELQITDVENFENALFNGIGRSKAFGCGLLMIRRV
jgi:CRISPR system Cascade subunit CasE